MRLILVVVYLCEIDFGEVGPGEIDFGEVGPGEVDLGEVGPGEVDLGEVGPGEVDLGVVFLEGFVGPFFPWKNCCYNPSIFFLKNIEKKERQKSDQI